jgi:hypothetical protein
VRRLQDLPAFKQLEERYAQLRVKRAQMAGLNKAVLRSKK